MGLPWIPLVTAVTLGAVFVGVVIKARSNDRANREIARQSESEDGQYESSSKRDRS